MPSIKPATIREEAKSKNSAQVVVGNKDRKVSIKGPQLKYTPMRKFRDILDSFYPTFQYSNQEDHYTASLVNPFFMDQLQWDYGLIRSTLGSNVPDIKNPMICGFDPIRSQVPCKDVIPLMSKLDASSNADDKGFYSNLLVQGKINDTASTAPSSIQNEFPITAVLKPNAAGALDTNVASYPKYNSVVSTDLVGTAMYGPRMLRGPDIDGALTTQYSTSDKWFSMSPIINPSVDPRVDRGYKSCETTTSLVDVAGGAQMVHCYWLNDKHSRRKLQAKTYALSQKAGFSAQAGTDANGNMYIQPHQALSDVPLDVEYTNPTYELLHASKTVEYTNTSNNPVYMEFVEAMPWDTCTGPMEYYPEFVANLVDDSTSSGPYHTYKDELLDKAGHTVQGSTSSNKYREEEFKLNPTNLGALLNDHADGVPVAKTSFPPQVCGTIPAAPLTKSMADMVITPKLFDNVNKQSDLVYQKTNSGYTKVIDEKWMYATAGTFVKQVVDKFGQQLGTDMKQAEFVPNDSEGKGYLMKVGPCSNQPLADQSVYLPTTSNTDGAVHQSMPYQASQFMSLTPLRNKEDLSYDVNKMSDITTPAAVEASKDNGIENSDIRLCLPNTANEFVKLWRMDYIDTKSKPGQGKRPFGVPTAELNDPVADDQLFWCKAKSRPFAGKEFRSKYKKMRSTKVCVMPGCTIEYQMIQNGHVEGRSKLLKHDLPLTQAQIKASKRQFVERFEPFPLTNEFFDKNSKLLFVFAHGADMTYAPLPQSKEPLPKSMPGPCQMTFKSHDFTRVKSHPVMPEVGHQFLESRGVQIPKETINDGRFFQWNQDNERTAYQELVDPDFETETTITQTTTETGGVTTTSTSTATTSKRPRSDEPDSGMGIGTNAPSARAPLTPDTDP